MILRGKDCFVTPLLTMTSRPVIASKAKQSLHRNHMNAAEEIVAIVDAQNTVIGAVPRREMRAKNLLHRSTYILVCNSRGELYVQKRTLTKDVFPGYYDPATGGVVLAGESYEQGAVRELEEEMGI